MRETPADRIILHVDMDAFFASVEALDRPELKGRPLIVGGRPERHGVVAAASYEARRFGVHSAMPVVTALRRCPDAVLLPPRGERYAELSDAVMAVLRCYTPLVEPLSVDEAFLDVTASVALFGDGPRIARAIKARMVKETGLTCSVGVAPNKFLAKVASDLDKPDGLTVIASGEAAARLAPLPVDRLWGVGPKTVERLAVLGVTLIGDLQRASLPAIERVFGDGAAHLVSLAFGLDDRPVETHHDPKSLSRETTFAVFTGSRDRLEAVLLELADDVASRLRADGWKAGSVHLKVRDETFRTVTRALSLAEPVDTGAELYAAARRMFRQRVDLGGRKVRLIGIGAASLVAGRRVPGELIPDPSKRRREAVERAVDAIRERHGDGAVLRARHLDPDDDPGANPWEGRGRA